MNEIWSGQPGGPWEARGMIDLLRVYEKGDAVAIATLWSRSMWEARIVMLREFDQWGSIKVVGNEIYIYGQRVACGEFVVIRIGERAEVVGPDNNAALYLELRSLIGE